MTPLLEQIKVSNVANPHVASLIRRLQHNLTNCYGDSGHYGDMSHSDQHTDFIYRDGWDIKYSKQHGDYSDSSRPGYRDLYSD